MTVATATNSSPLAGLRAITLSNLQDGVPDGALFFCEHQILYRDRRSATCLLISGKAAELKINSGLPATCVSRYELPVYDKHCPAFPKAL